MGKSTDDLQEQGASLSRAKQLHAFANDIKVGDLVLLYDNRVKRRATYLGKVIRPPSDLVSDSESNLGYYHVPRGHRLDFFPGKNNAPNRLNVRWMELSGKTSFRVEFPWNDAVHEIVPAYLDPPKRMFQYIIDQTLKSFLKKEIGTILGGPRPMSPEPILSNQRPKWVFQAREYTDGKKNYPLDENIPKVLKRPYSKQIVHWFTVEHRYKPVRMEEGDLVLLFQGATKRDSVHGFHGTAVITNLRGRCTAPVKRSHHQRNAHNRRIGVDLRYLSQFSTPLVTPINLRSSLDNENLQKLIQGGKGGSAQDAVFRISDDDWKVIRPHLVPYMRQSPSRRTKEKRGRRHGWNPIDPERKVEIERSAIKLVKASFAKEGFDVASVEKDNKGWDLDAWRNGLVLHLEVKGLSGDVISVELTPNEYENVMSRASDYRICVVTRALERRALHVYAYSEESGEWEDKDGNALKADEKTGARMYL